MMERLTGYENIAGHCHNIPLVDTRLVVDRLAAYEDTGLTPEQVKAQKWISVNDVCPETFEDVMLYMPKSKRLKRPVHEGYYTGERFVVDKLAPDRCPRVTHWMPLPEPPKEAHDE